MNLNATSHFLTRKPSLYIGLISACLLILCVISFKSHADELKVLTQDQLTQYVNKVNQLQNQVLMKGSTVADADALFEQYTADFKYVHEVYGGTYTRQHLYNNTVKFLKAGNYDYTEPRYTIKNMLFGLNTVAVLRQQNDGETHLAVFEFKQNKVAKITEYWQ